jgi:hypothetical protein
MSERRRDDRRETEIRAEVHSQGRRVTGEVRNLSLDGAGLALPEAVAAGEALLALAIVDDAGETTPDTPPLVLPAIVVWTAEVDARRWAAGLRFGAMDEAALVRLERFLSTLDE